VDNNYLDLGMNKSGFVHTLPSGRLRWGGMRGMVLPFLGDIIAALCFAFAAF
jgi:hypothetical protein